MVSFSDQLRFFLLFPAFAQPLRQKEKNITFAREFPVICIFFTYTLVMQYSSPDEWFPVVDEEGHTISLALRSECHNGKSKLLHPVVHLHFFNKKGELFLQKRAKTKDILPGCWDTSVGGHISPGETPEEGLKRELFEELGISDIDFTFLKKYVWESERERELVYSFKSVSEIIPVINKEEIDEGRFWSADEIRKNPGREIFTPNFKHEFSVIIAKEFLHFGSNK